MARFKDLNPIAKGAIVFGIFVFVIWGNGLRSSVVPLIPGRQAPSVTWTDSGNAEDSIKELLRDPDSADFSHWMVGRDGYTCGTVNAKNGFGGMSGRKMFAVRGREVILETNESNGDKLAEIARICL